MLSGVGMRTARTVARFCASRTIVSGGTGGGGASISMTGPAAVSSCSSAWVCACVPDGKDRIAVKARAGAVARAVSIMNRRITLPDVATRRGVRCGLLLQPTALARSSWSWSKAQVCHQVERGYGESRLPTDLMLPATRLVMLSSVTCEGLHTGSGTLPGRPVP